MNDKITLVLKGVGADITETYDLKDWWVSASIKSENSGVTVTTEVQLNKIISDEVKKWVTHTQLVEGHYK